MPPRKRARLFLTAVLLAVTSAGFGPAKPEVTKEQLAYSKQMFAEGEKAMKAGDYATALAKYQDGYRYAPHLHVFTYSIAAAAEASGDCHTAFTYYGMFLDLVPKHAERAAVQKKHDALAKSCQPTQPSEPVDVVAEPPARSRDRGDREGERAMSQALTELRSAKQMYAAAASAHPKGPFKRAAKRKTRDIKRMRKLAAELSVVVEDGDLRELPRGSTSKEACREGERQENRIIEAVEAALERYEEQGSTQKVAYRVLRGAERDEARFEGCR